MKPPLKILILEDSDDDAKIIQRLLQKNDPGYEFFVVMNRYAYIKALNEFQPHVILSDNSLPQFNALEALQIIKQRSLHIPFILVTGTVSEEFAANIIKLGADDYLLKDRLARLPVAIEAALKQKKTEKEKSDAEEKIKFKAELLNTIGQAVLATDLAGVIKYWNKAAEEIYGWTSGEAMDKNVADLIPTQKTKEQDIEIMKQLEQGNYWSGELIVSRKDGKNFPIYVTDAPIYDQHNNLCGVIGVSTVITDRKKTEKYLKDLNEQLRSLSAHLQNVREQERTQVAREIHDEIGQQLTGLKMEISLLFEKLATEDQIIQQKGNDILNLIDRAVNSVQRISSNLRPPILDELGLIAALEWHSQEVEIQSGIKIEFMVNTRELNLPTRISTALFRIYQEALANIVGHANAHQVISRLQINDNNLTLEVGDDGQSVDPVIKNNKKTLGLINIEERAFLLGGKFELNGEPGVGAKIKITIPL